MDRPVLSLQTVYFHGSDRAEAQRLGNDLYAHLTRPIDDPLAHGAGIPVSVAVAANAVDLESADVLVLLPVLGKNSFNLQADHVIDTLTRWHTKLGPGHVLPVPISINWRNAEHRLPGKQFLTELYESADPRRKTIDEIVHSVSRLLIAKNTQPGSATAQAPVSPRLFISHAKADLKATDAAAKRIYDYVVTDSTGRAFYDSVALHAGESLEEQIDEAVEDGMLIVVRTDSYSSRAWCQRELLRAKLHELPTLTVEVLRRGERRTSPYGGNSPSLVWTGDADAVASRAMVEYLRAAFFRLEAKRIAAAAELPADTRILSRPPELLDLAQGPLQAGFAQLILHPDPELPVIERQVLRSARPRLQLATPTTAFRRLLGPETDTLSVSSPLEGMQIAMSLSDSPDVDGPAGFTAQHVIDATVYIARAMISAGATIAYGGDFRKSGFTPLLATLIQSYNQTASKSAGELHSYLAANLSVDDAPDDLPLKIHHLVDSPEVAMDAMLPPPSQEQHPSALYFSDLRRVMAMHTDARVVLGGQSKPRLQPDGPGYGGLYPGVVEEAWRTLEADQPLYVIGGFGGAAALVADLLEGNAIPAELLDETWREHDLFSRVAEDINADPYRARLDLPQGREELATAIIRLSAPLLRDDDAAIRWNGLTVAQNQILFRSRDPVTLASLVLKGLLRVARQRSGDKTVIELVHGSVTGGAQLDAIAIATFDNVPLGGAGAVLDQVIGGQATMERSSGRSLFQLGSAAIDANWMFLASLGALDEIEFLAARIERAARETVELARRHGFRRIGVVAFGGAVAPDLELVVDAMLRGFAELPHDTSIVWFETSDDRYRQLHELLAQAPQVQLSTIESKLASIPTPAPEEPFVLQVTWQNEALTVTSLPPSGSAVASVRHIGLDSKTMDQLQELASGSQYAPRATPDMQTLRERGQMLSSLLLGPDAAQLLSRSGSAPIAIIHDLAASKIPFEILATQKPDARPAVDTGIHRRLMIPDLPVERLFAKPPKHGKLHVLLIVNPTQDLPGAEKEGYQVAEILKQRTDRVALTILARSEATREAVLRALERADVLHYCGHAYFGGPEPGESGLLLADQRLTALELRQSASLPRVAFVNACEAGRVRGQVENDAAAFAELFLRSGVEAYLGTFWEVSDSAATQFAAGVYTRLAAGQRLDAAVRESRQDLLQANEPDWANYILYGDGRFQLIQSSQPDRTPLRS